MRTSSAPGMDGITAGMLRKAWPALGESITHLFDRCIKEGSFPNCWKVARLVIIPKPGATDLSLVKSFRPISLLPVLGKALESIIILKIDTETTLNEQKEQHGFTAGKSTISALGGADAPKPPGTRALRGSDRDLNEERVGHWA